jgi:hypothetical protein
VTSVLRIGSIVRLQVPRVRMTNGWALGKFGGEFAQVAQTYRRHQRESAGSPFVFVSERVRRCLYDSCLMGTRRIERVSNVDTISWPSFGGRFTFPRDSSSPRYSGPRLFSNSGNF